MNDFMILCKRKKSLWVDGKCRPAEDVLQTFMLAGDGQCGGLRSVCVCLLVHAVCDWLFPVLMCHSLDVEVCAYLSNGCVWFPASQDVCVLTGLASQFPSAFFQHPVFKHRNTNTHTWVIIHPELEMQSMKAAESHANPGAWLIFAASV